MSKLISSPVVENLTIRHCPLAKSITGLKRRISNNKTKLAVKNGKQIEAECHKVSHGKGIMAT